VAARKASTTTSSASVQAATTMSSRLAKWLNTVRRETSASSATPSTLSDAGPEARASATAASMIAR
jgi:hypothetical protein